MGRLSVIIPDELKQKLESLKKEKETSASLLLRLIEDQEQLQVIQGLNLTEARC
jgi:predicted CopG family antitoxin